jgi:hypothetical protein
MSAALMGGCFLLFLLGFSVCDPFVSKLSVTCDHNNRTPQTVNEKRTLTKKEIKQ